MRRRRAVLLAGVSGAGMLVCLLAAAGGDAPSLAPSGVAVEARAAAVSPALELPGRLRSTQAGSVISHYGYWSNIMWLAPEGSHITKGQKAAVVFAGNLSDRAATASYWLEETVAAGSEEEATVALNAAERGLTVQQAEWDVQESKLELAVLQAGPDPAALGAAELEVKRAGLELTAAEAALSRLKTLRRGNVAVSEEKLTQAEHVRDLARIHLSEVKNALAELKQGPDPTALAQAQGQVDQAQAALDAARATADAGKQKDAADLAAARAQVASVRASWAELYTSNRAKTRMATASGIVVWPPIYKGGKSRPGVASLWATPILSIIDPARAAFIARASEEQVSRLRVGMEASVRLEGVPGGSLAGKVTAIASTSQDLSDWYKYTDSEQRPDTGVRLYEVVIAVERRKGLGLYQGMAGRAEVRIGGRATHTLIPRACVKTVGDRDWALVGSAGTWTPRPVVTGGVEGSYVTVKQGLRPGERVALLAQ